MSGFTTQKEVIVDVNVKITNESNEGTTLQEFRLSVALHKKARDGEYSEELSSQQQFGILPGREVKRGYPVTGVLCFEVREVLGSLEKHELVAGTFVLRIRDGFDEWVESKGITENGPALH